MKRTTGVFAETAWARAAYYLVLYMLCSHHETVFATGAMYFAMLLIGWNTHHTIKRWTIDVGWTSTWVRIVNEWLAVCVYLWMLVAPVILKWRQTSESA